LCLKSGIRRRFLANIRIGLQDPVRHCIKPGAQPVYLFKHSFFLSRLFTLESGTIGLGQAGTQAGAAHPQ